MTDRVSARLVEVHRVYYGSELATQATAGATEIELVDPDDFDEPADPAEEPGAEPTELAGLLVDPDDEETTEPITYTAVNYDTAVVSLAAPLAATWPAGTLVRIDPDVDEREATVRLGEDPEDLLDAFIRHDLYDKLEEGIRAEGEGEAVVLEEEEEDEGVWWVVDVLGKAPEVDGSYIAPGTIAPSSVNDGVAPSSSPAIDSIFAGPRWFALRWTRDSVNPDPVTYEVHAISEAGREDSDWIADATTYSHEIRADFTFARAYGVGPIAFAYETQYWFALVAKDADGSAARGAEFGPVTLDPNASDDMAFGSLLAEHFQGTKVEGLTIIAGDEGSAHIKMDDDGLVIKDDLLNSVIAFSFTGGSTFRGIVQALGLEVEGTATIRNRLEMGPGSEQQFMRGQGSPSTAPTVESTWDSLTLGTDTHDRRGAFHDPLGYNPAGGTQPTFFILAVTFGDLFWEIAAREYRASDGVFLREEIVAPSSPNHALGVVRAGSHIFTLARGGPGTPAQPVGTWLEKRDQSDLGFVDVRNIEGDITGSHDGVALGLDPGTQGGLYPNGLLLVATTTADSETARLRVRRYNPANLALVDTITAPAGTGIGSPRWTGIVVAEGKWWLTTKKSTPNSAANLKTNAVHRFATDGSYDAQEEFPTPATPYGLAHDGSVFWTLEQTENIRKHTNEVTNGGNVGFTWRDTVNGYETLLGPEKTAYAHKKRSRMSVSLPTFPDGVDAGGIYLNNLKQADQTVQTAHYTSFISGPASPAANTFPDSTPAKATDKDGNTMMDADGVKQSPARGALGALVATSETTGTVASFVDLATVGPSVTLTPPSSGKVLVCLYGLIGNSGAANSFMGFEASGGNTVAASFNRSISTRSNNNRGGATFLLTGLAQSSTTFTAKYRVGAGTGDFADRRIVVVPL